MQDRQVIVWGPGRIGRGFVARVFFQPGYHLVFVDVVKPLIEELNRHPQYTIFSARAEGIEQTVVSGYQALHTSQQQEIMQAMLTDSPIVSVTVHASILKDVAHMLAPYIRERARTMPENPMDFLLNVNMMDPEEALTALMLEELKDDQQAQAYFKDRVGLVTTVVMCITPFTPKEILDKDPLALYNNGYPQLVAGRAGFKGKLPELAGLRLSDNIRAEEVRKIYTLNMSHAVSCYLGMPKGFTYVVEAVQDPEMRAVIERALEEAAVGLMGEFGFSREEMQAWNRDIIKMLENPYINDQLQRLGADTQRKLSWDDRVVGVARLCLKHGGRPETLARAIRAGFSYQNDDPGTQTVLSCVRDKGLEGALREICGLSPEDTLYQMVMSAR